MKGRGWQESTGKTAQELGFLCASASRGGCSSGCRWGEGGGAPGGRQVAVGVGGQETGVLGVVGLKAWAGRTISGRVRQHLRRLLQAPRGSRGALALAHPHPLLSWDFLQGRDEPA